ncbi:hypothetical protein Pfo_018316 [Paulownia fortunei]|nr:hypothetical protein Pfo_018316 [Paulownia fortunei]
MTSQYIIELPSYCSPQLWTSTCPLIFYARVEMRHPERDCDTYLHRFDRRGYIGFDWEAHHIQYISAWIRRFETIVRRPLIRDTVTRDDGYDEWYDRVTRRFISPANRADQLTSLNISARMRPLEDLTAANSLLERYISVGKQVTTLLVSRDLPSQMPSEQAQPLDDTQITINRRRRGRTQRSSSSVEGDTTSRTQIPPFTGHASTSYHCPPAADDYFPFTPFDPIAYMYSHVQLNLDLGLMPENISRPEFNISPVPFPPMTSMYRDHIHDTSSSSYHNTYVDDNSQTDEISQYFDTVAQNRGERARGYRNRRPRGCGTDRHY